MDGDFQLVGVHRRWDGVSAYEAGAELMDMEFVQFHPTGMVWPPGVQGILVIGKAVRGEGGIYVIKHGERFMEKYDPKRMELSTARCGSAVDLYGSARRARDAAWWGVPGYFAQAGGVREEKIAEHVSPV